MFIRGKLPNKPIKSRTGYTQRGGYVIDQAEQASGAKSQSLVASALEKEASVSSQVDGYSGGTCLVYVVGVLLGSEIDPLYSQA